MNAAKSSSVNASSFMRLLIYLLQDRAVFFIAVSMALASSLCLVASPWLIGHLIDVIATGELGDQLLLGCGLLIVLFSASALFSWGQAHTVASLSQTTVTRIRSDYFAHLQRLPVGFFLAHRPGDLISRATNDLDVIATTLNQGAVQLVTSSIMILASLGIMFYTSALLALVSLVFLILMVASTRIIAYWSRRSFAAQQKNMGLLNACVQESLEGQKTFRLYGNALITAHTESAILAVKKSTWRSQILSGSMGPTMNTFNNLGFVFIAVVGGYLVTRGDITLGIVVAFLACARQLERPMTELANQFNLFQSALAGAERTFAILDEPLEVDDSHKLHINFKGNIRFEGIQFSYGERQVLCDVSFSLDAGKTLALVGPTGSGKSTLFNLLLGFIHASRGTIYLDEQPLGNYSREHLRRQMGVVLQDAHLFNDTVFNNLRYGKPQATLEEVITVAQMTGADAVIQKLPQGYMTRLGSDGISLSEGQKQFLSITRTLLLDPAILLLDEATSRLDVHSEQQVQQALRRLMHNRTCLVIAHRLDTITQADQILVLEAGQVIESGTHESLRQARGLYSQLYG
jgi:ATP-binding cassette subfamily B multidrug efflux pump